NAANAVTRSVQECTTPSDIAESPLHSPVCALRQPHLHPAQTASARHLATARQRDVVCALCLPLVTASARRWRRSVAPGWLYYPYGCGCTRREHYAQRTLHIGQTGPEPRRPRAWLL